MTAATGFRKRFLDREQLYGSFLKIPATMPAEILGALGYDFVVVDEEHSPFNRETTDAIVLACRAWGIASIVRVQSAEPSTLLSVLDCGADGVLVPHVDSAEKARAVVAACRYRPGSRGFAPTTRAGAFGADGMEDHIARQDARVTTIAMIEDPEAVDCIEEIVEVEGLDGIFIGRGDLGAAYAAEGRGPEAVAKATRRVLSAAHGKKPVAILPGNPKDAADMAAQGVTSFILSSDQGFLKNAAGTALSNIRGSVESTR